MNTYANVAARPREGGQGIDPTGDGIDPIATTLIQLGETKGAARQLEGRRCRCGWGGADPSTPTLVKPGEMKGAARRRRVPTASI